ncbi:MAG TPA: hypothetical protein VFQ32_11290 [Ktedonobacterales bacterium]|nr:hypothetical protein [Ktedonobacterales bacterium]
MSSRRKLWLLAACALALYIVITGCSSDATFYDSSGSTPASGSTPGSSGDVSTITASGSPHALAWFQPDSKQVGQIWASVNGGAAHQVTHLTPVAGACRNDTHWSPPVFSPDLSKIVAAWGGSGCSNNPQHGPIYVINTATGAATQVPASDIRLSLRETGWVNNSTIWWLKGKQLITYTLGGANTVVGALSGDAVGDAVLRGSTLFYTTSVGSSYQLARYDMASHALLGGAISLGSIAACQCARGDALMPGFDVSADGAHVVYQKITPGGSNTEGVGSSQFFYANADSTGARQIATAASAASFVKMQLSPNGKLVAVARAEPSPNSVFTASVTSSGNSDDPSLRFYEMDARGYPVWNADSASFWASTLDLDTLNPPITGDIDLFNARDGSSGVGIAGGANPWYTLGG